MNRILKTAVGLSLAAMLWGAWSLRAQACTTVLIPRGDSRLLANNYDWEVGVGAVHVNKRGVTKRALVPRTETHPAQWTSRFGSVTYNQHGRELPIAGMNEAGLIVETMWLNSAQYPMGDERPTVNELQWVQYQLDNYSSVADVLLNLNKIRIARIYANVHFMACDLKTCAAIEFIGGKAVLHSGVMMPAPTLTNDTYESSLAELHKYVGFGGTQPIPGVGDTRSKSRFVRATALARNFSGELGLFSTEDAFSVLQDVSKENTKWNLVYDPLHLQMWFRTESNRQIRRLEFRGLSFDCQSTVKVGDMSLGAAGEFQQNLVDYTPASNEALVRAGASGLNPPLPDEIIQKVSRYPETTHCGSSLLEHPKKKKVKKS